MYVHPLQIKKRRSLSKRIKESFREQKDDFSDTDVEEHLVNKVLVERYFKNNLSDNCNNNNLNIHVKENNPMPKLSRRSTSVKRSAVSCFLSNKKKNNLITSFREMNNLGYQKQVRSIKMHAKSGKFSSFGV